MEYITVNKSAASQLSDIVQNASAVALVPDPDKKIDSLAASYAVASILERLGKKVRIHFLGKVPEQIGFINLAQYIKTTKPNSSESYIYVNDHIPCSDPGNTLHIYTAKNTAPACTCASSQSFESFCEAVTNYIREINDEYITPDAATALLAGITATTNSFKKTDTPSETFFCAAYLVSKRANNELISYRINKNKPEELIRLWGSVAANFSFDEVNALGWCTVNAEHIKDLETKRRYIAYIINEIKSNFSQAKTIVLGINEGGGKKTALVHTTDNDKLHRASSLFSSVPKNGSFLVTLSTEDNLNNATHECVNALKTVLV